MSQGAKIAIFIIILFIIIGIATAITWWFVNEQPKQIFRNIMIPLPCPRSNACNSKGPAEACSPHQCTFNPPTGSMTTCPCNVSTGQADADPVDEVILT